MTIPILAASACTSILIDANSDDPLYSEIIVGGNIEAAAVTFSKDAGKIFVTLEGRSALIYRFDHD